MKKIVVILSLLLGLASCYAPSNKWSEMYYTAAHNTPESFFGDTAVIRFDIAETVVSDEKVHISHVQYEKFGEDFIGYLYTVDTDLVKKITYLIMREGAGFKMERFESDGYVVFQISWKNVFFYRDKNGINIL